MIWPPNLIDLTRKRIALIAKVAAVVFAGLDAVAFVTAIIRGGGEWKVFGIASGLVAVMSAWAFVLSRG